MDLMRRVVGMASMAGSFGMVWLVSVAESS